MGSPASAAAGSCSPSLSFTLEPGQGLLVTGPNGAGKTSLLRLIAGLLPLAGGSFESGDATPPAA